MKNVLKIFLLLIAPISIVACNAQSSFLDSKSSNEGIITTAEVNNINSDINAKKNIVLYMIDHDSSGLEKPFKSDAHYYWTLNRPGILSEC